MTITYYHSYSKTYTFEFCIFHSNVYYFYLLYILARNNASPASVLFVFLSDHWFFMIIFLNKQVHKNRERDSHLCLTSHYRITSNGRNGLDFFCVGPQSSRPRLTHHGLALITFNYVYIFDWLSHQITNNNKINT